MFGKDKIYFFSTIKLVHRKGMLLKVIQFKPKNKRQKKEISPIFFMLLFVSIQHKGIDRISGEINTGTSSSCHCGCEFRIERNDRKICIPAYLFIKGAIGKLIAYI